MELEKFHADLFSEYWIKFKSECDEYMIRFMNMAQKKGYIHDEINIMVVHSVWDIIMRTNHELLKSGKYTENDLRNSTSKPFMRGIFTVEGRRVLNKLIKGLNL